MQTPVVCELNVTGRPDPPPVAETVPVPPKVMVGAAPKVMVWLALLIVMFWVAWLAAFQFELPDWFAAIWQVPIVTPVTVLPLMVQTPVVWEV